MNKYGYIRVSAVSPCVRISDIEYNLMQIENIVRKSAQNNVDVLVMPELGLTGYTCADLFGHSLLIKKAEKALIKLSEIAKERRVAFAVGAPVLFEGSLYNCGVMFGSDGILGIIPKIHIPNYSEFYEKRWFRSGVDISNGTLMVGNREVPFGTDLLFETKGVKIGIEICEDLWVPEPPSGRMVKEGADVILNLSASDEVIGKHKYLKTLISQQSARCRCVYAYASAGSGESSTDLVFAGSAIIAEDGQLFEGERDFTPRSEIIITRDVDIEKLRVERMKFNSFYDKDIESYRRYRVIKDSTENSEKDLEPDVAPDPRPFVPEDYEGLEEHCKEIINIQTAGLMQRLLSIGCEKCVIGISGGLDSTLALLVTVEAFDRLGLSRKGIIAITMPGNATTQRTKSNAVKLMELLGVTALEIPIGDAVKQHFKDIGQNPNKYDAAYENSQARERTQILMDKANQENAIVIGTGDLSELALGWCTYNGDHMSMYGVNASVPKTLVKHLVKWFAANADDEAAKVLIDIVETPISPELIPSSSESDDIAQKTEDLVGPYELHDFFLYHFLRNSFRPRKIFMLACRAFNGRYDENVILHWMKIFFKRFFSQQFKRSCMPDGPKVGSVSLSPRGDWRMPSDASAALWLQEIEDISGEMCKAGKI